jgi:hypothetical protein
MTDLKLLKEHFDILTRDIKVSKVYLETHHDLITVDENTILTARKFFIDCGIKTAGGITLTVDEDIILLAESAKYDPQLSRRSRTS